MTTVFIISAPSGSGKSSLVKRLIPHVPGLMFSVSYTTRKPRGAESEGHNYHFLSREQFEKMIGEDERDRRHAAGLNHEQQAPSVKKGHQRMHRVAQIDVLTA